MEGKFYAIKKGITTPEIENSIDVQKYGQVIILDTHPLYDRIIEVADLNHSDAVLLSKTELRELTQNYINQVI